MKNKYIFGGLLAALWMTAVDSSAQEGIEASAEATIVSHYVWRGLDMADACIQPTLTIGWKGLSFNADGSMGLTNSDDNKEIDLTASYTTGGLTVGVADLWTESYDKRYFYYNAHSTNHVFEAFVSYDFSILSASWQTNFAGDDGTDKKGKRAYSSYFELNAPFRLANLDWQATAGLVPWASSYYETTGLAVTNLSVKAMKDLQITDRLKLPVYVQLAGNPCSQRGFIIFGLTLSTNQ